MGFPRAPRPSALQTHSIMSACSGSDSDAAAVARRPQGQQPDVSSRHSAHTLASTPPPTLRRARTGGSMGSGASERGPNLALLPDSALAAVWQHLPVGERRCVMPLVCRRFRQLAATCSSLWEQVLAAASPFSACQQPAPMSRPARSRAARPSTSRRRRRLPRPAAPPAASPACPRRCTCPSPRASSAAWTRARCLPGW